MIGDRWRLHVDVVEASDDGEGKHNASSTDCHREGSRRRDRAGRRLRWFVLQSLLFLALKPFLFLTLAALGFRSFLFVALALFLFLQNLLYCDNKPLRITAETIVSDFKCILVSQ